MAHLILMRHAKSEWNKLGLWTGWTDVSLSKEGEKEAENSAAYLKGIPIHKAYTSTLKRAKETWDIVRHAIGLAHIPAEAHDALKERHYGHFTGKNKWEVKKEIGEEAFQKIRRGWNHPIPGGETLKKVSERVMPFYHERVFPEIVSGNSVILIAHGNSLRSLVKHLEDIHEDDIHRIEIGVGEAWIYTLDNSGKVVSKEIRAENLEKGKI